MNSKTIIFIVISGLLLIGFALVLDQKSKPLNYTNHLINSRP
jgi:hypothetical protein